MQLEIMLQALGYFSPEYGIREQFKEITRVTR